MLDEIFVDHLWVVLAVWVAVHCSDYALTILCARVYRGGANSHLVHETLELNPFFQKDVARLRWVSPRFLLMLCLTCGLLAAAWTLQAIPSLAEESLYTAALFRAVLGSFLLAEFALHVRHFGNLVLFAYARRSLGIEGKVRISKWLSYRVSATNLASFALLYLLCFLLTNNWFFAGGAAACCILATKHGALSTRGRRDSVVTDVELVEGDDGGPRA